MRNTTLTCRAVPSSGPSRTIRFVGATESVARDGGILKMDGWQLDGYRSNPVFLWAHDQKQPPIGRAVRVGRGSEGLEFDIEFAPPDVYPFADLVGRLYEAGFMRAVSVGFRVLEERPPTSAERSQGAQWVSDSHELLELSAVPVGADASALKAAREALKPEDAVLLRGMGEEFAPLAEAVEAAQPPAISESAVRLEPTVAAEERPYDSAGNKIPHPTPEQIAAYEEEKKKKKQEEEGRAVPDLSAVLEALARLEAKVDVLSSILAVEEDLVLSEGPQDAADAAAEQAVDAPVVRTSDADPYDILAKARLYAGRKD